MVWQNWVISTQNEYINYSSHFKYKICLKIICLTFFWKFLPLIICVLHVCKRHDVQIYHLTFILRTLESVIRVLYVCQWYDVQIYTCWISEGSFSAALGLEPFCLFCDQVVICTIRPRLVPVLYSFPRSLCSFCFAPCARSSRSRLFNFLFLVTVTVLVAFVGLRRQAAVSVVLWRDTDGSPT